MRSHTHPKESVHISSCTAGVRVVVRAVWPVRPTLLWSQLHSVGNECRKDVVERSSKSRRFFDEHINISCECRPHFADKFEENRRTYYEMSSHFQRNIIEHSSKFNKTDSVAIQCIQNIKHIRHPHCVRMGGRHFVDEVRNVIEMSVAFRRREWNIQWNILLIHWHVLGHFI